MVGMTRETARIVGDAKGTKVTLPAGRGFSGRTLLAKTCKGCGELRDVGDFPVTGSARTPDPRCNGCHAIRLRGYDWRRRKGSMHAHEAKRQADTLATASRHGEQWTGPQLEIALRDDLTAFEAAKILGRSHIAVRNIRRRSRLDPRVSALAGQAAS